MTTPTPRVGESSLHEGSAAARLLNTPITKGVAIRRTVTVLCLSAMAIAAPTAGMAVSVSSSDGNGTQNVTTWYSNGAYLDGNLRSAVSGRPVYYQGLVVINNCSDTNDGRYTGNATSTSYVNVGGEASSASLIWPCSLDGVKAAVCEDINNLPDDCVLGLPLFRADARHAAG